jgi:hypothetical protein
VGRVHILGCSTLGLHSVPVGSTLDLVVLVPIRDRPCIGTSTVVNSAITSIYYIYIRASFLVEGGNDTFRSSESR